MTLRTELHREQVGQLRYIAVLEDIEQHQEHRKEEDAYADDFT